MLVSSNSLQEGLQFFCVSACEMFVSMFCGLFFKSKSATLTALTRKLYSGHKVGNPYTALYEGVLPLQLVSMVFTWFMFLTPPINYLSHILFVKHVTKNKFVKLWVILLTKSEFWPVFFVLCISLYGTCFLVGMEVFWRWYGLRFAQILGGNFFTRTFWMTETQPHIGGAPCFYFQYHETCGPLSTEDIGIQSMVQEQMES